ncbi:DUF6364 family protein [Catalinimonas sp. 4WD22]|uniref:DUF6364 family protein n=1 Tax=Catalinimonas locisalis TaxID=3133978 RepID=UPI003100ADD9
MNTKLTLKLDKAIIERAKQYAKSHHTSVSKMVEDYLHMLTAEDRSSIEVTPLVESLTGIIDTQEKDYKREYADYLSKKYQQK